MKINVLSDFNIPECSLISLKKMGSIFEVCYTEHKNAGIYIQLIDKDHYANLKTGEILECNHISNRSESIAQVSQSLKRLRDYINTNVIDVTKCKWITLTYAENMTDRERLYKDMEKFVKKMRYKYGHFDYIVACEPQGRGAWHSHCIFIFDSKAPFIPNDDLSSIWGHGFTKTQKLDSNIDNIGAYLTAYLGDMPLDECLDSGIRFNLQDIKLVDSIGNENLKVPKKFVKGARLYLYPPNFNIYRISRGIKKPIREFIPYDKFKAKIGDKSPTYKKSIELSENDFKNKIVYEYYNIKRETYQNNIKTIS